SRADANRPIPEDCHARLPLLPARGGAAAGRGPEARGAAALSWFLARRLAVGAAGAGGRDRLRAGDGAAVGARGRPGDAAASPGGAVLPARAAAGVRATLPGRARGGAAARALRAAHAGAGGDAGVDAPPR